LFLVSDLVEFSASELIVNMFAGEVSGTAAALAANMMPMADGSDLGGSLRSPASVCGAVGFRPTTGQVPKRSAPLLFDPLHVFGPMSHSVTCNARTSLINHFIIN
jgi:Asp-tRNA(Asn)/Glu-tRNA(Gln) amidotransferase A subunit family amidase